MSDDLHTITAEVRTYVASLGPVSDDELDDDTSLLDQGAVDSLGLVQIQLFLEQRLGREIEPAEFDQDTLITIAAIARWLATAVRGSNANRR